MKRQRPTRRRYFRSTRLRTEGRPSISKPKTALWGTPGFAFSSDDCPAPVDVVLFDFDEILSPGIMPAVQAVKRGTMQVIYDGDSFGGFDRTTLYRLRFRKVAAGLLHGRLVDPPVILLFWPVGCAPKAVLFPRTHCMFPPERIICLTEETVETLYLLGEQDRIVGVSGYVVRPPEARRDKPRVSAFTSADTGKILALKPDLVFTFSDLQAEIVADLIRSGVQVHALNHRTIAGILDMIRMVGALVGAADRADALARAAMRCGWMRRETGQPNCRGGPRCFSRSGTSR